MQEYTANRWVKVGLALVVLGWGPLLAIIVLAALHLWPDPNPNPIGPGLLFFFTFWPAVGCLGVGAVQVARARKHATSDAVTQGASQASAPRPDQADWISNPAVRVAAAIAGLILIVKGGVGLRHGGGRGAAAAIVLGAGALYWAVVGRLPMWLRR